MVYKYTFNYLFPLLSLEEQSDSPYPIAISDCPGQLLLPFDLVTGSSSASASWTDHSLIDGLLMLSVIYLVAGVSRSRQLTKLPYIHITMYIPVLASSIRSLPAAF